MIRFFPFLLLLCGCASLSSSSISDLSNWNELGDAAWSIDGDEVIGSGTGDGFLVSRNQYESYRLTLQFSVDETTNSGVFIHCSNPREITPLNCYEINIWDNHPRQEFRTGAIVTRVRPFETINTLGQWNTYEITVDKGRLEVLLNGQLVSALDGPGIERGYIALQRAVSGEVKFRKLRLEPIGS